MNTIISKRTSPFVYQKWVKVNGQFFQDGPGIVINGGAGIVGGDELLSGRPLEKRGSLIPVGVMTFVDNDVLAKLESIGKFRKDVERGIVVVVRNKRLTQDAGDNIAEHDMIENDHIPTRPITADDMRKAGGVINKDGSVDISDADEGMSPARLRNADAGKPEYVKKRESDSRKQEAAEKKRARRSRK